MSTWTPEPCALCDHGRASECATHGPRDDAPWPINWLSPTERRVYMQDNNERN